ncbi:hypothetical protein [Bosea sp. AAP35]|uniref:hypothetical protein n=1 Tax=Bosea sp. AAP35 TaxID=1523417 RepID=UPI0018D17966|nr:hypothetical protein [Bosea sp. AAP35]
MVSRQSASEDIIEAWNPDGSLVLNLFAAFHMPPPISALADEITSVWMIPRNEPVLAMSIHLGAIWFPHAL